MSGVFSRCYEETAVVEFKIVFSDKRQKLNFTFFLYTPQAMLPTRWSSNRDSTIASQSIVCWAKFQLFGVFCRRVVI